MSGFARLHPSMRYLVTEVLRFPGLRPVQELTIDPVLDGRDCIVLAPTAGGKTEAAFFPVLSRVLSERWEPVPVLYICPLKALLNNQHPRLTRMADAVGLRVARWHGDVPQREKRDARREPPHVLMITPESLEVMLISPNDDAALFLRQVKIAIVDEVHAFANDPRGAHLVAILERLQRYAGSHVQRLGLSATVGNPEALARWLQGTDAVEAPIVVRPPPERASPVFRYRAARTAGEAARQIEVLGHHQKRLIFTQSRGEAERVAEALQAAGVASWVHHSSVSKDTRAVAEQAFELRPDAAIVATASLELGIDIGDLDHVFQMDAPNTVSSLAQRLGRTGRRAGAPPTMTFLCEDPTELLVAVSLARLFWEHGWVEDVEPDTRCWTVLAHQVLANLLETGGATLGQMVARLRFVPSFAGLDDSEIGGLVRHMTSTGWVDEVDGALVVGQRGEKEFGARNFFKLYAVFDSPESLTVRHGSREIGSLQTWFVLQLPGRPRTFRLAGKAWEVAELDLKRRVIRVVPARAGAVPQWTGRPAALSRRVCEEIRDLLAADTEIGGLDDTARSWLSHARELVRHLGLEDARRRPIERRDDQTVWHTFAGGRINLVLARVLQAELGLVTVSSNLSVKIKSTAAGTGLAVVGVVERLRAGEWPPTESWAELDTDKRTYLLSQFQGCLPDDAEQEFLRRVFFDVAGARKWLAEGWALGLVGVG